MIIKYLSFSISIVFISFLVGMMVYVLIQKSAYFTNRLEGLNFLPDEKWNRLIGVGIVKWIVKNTPFRFLNPTLQVNGKIDQAMLMDIRNRMTKAELEHLIAFVFVCFFILFKFYNSEWAFGFCILFINAAMNLYPTLLQQQNKRRISKLLKQKKYS